MRKGNLINMHKTRQRYNDGVVLGDDCPICGLLVASCVHSEEQIMDRLLTDYTSAFIELELDIILRRR
jgi:hypothetical protein